MQSVTLLKPLAPFLCLTCCFEVSLTPEASLLHFLPSLVSPALLQPLLQAVQSIPRWLCNANISDSEHLTGSVLVTLCLASSPPLSHRYCCRQSHISFCTLPAGVKLPKVAEPTGEAYSHAVSVLLPYLLSHRSRLAAFTAATDTARQAAASQASTTAGSHQATAQHQTASRPGEASEAGTPGGSYSEAMEEAGEPGSPMHSKPQEFLAGLQPEQRHRLAVLVDTAILKVRCASQAYKAACQNHMWLCMGGWYSAVFACSSQSLHAWLEYSDIPACVLAVEESEAMRVIH